MTNGLVGLTDGERRSLLLGAALKAAESLGYRLTRLPGRGRYSVYTIEKDGKSQKACIRTTRDRLIAFPPVSNGKKWKTLDDVDQVIVSTVDSKASPRNIEVYMFAAGDVHKRFNQAYKARKQQGTFTEDEFGFWVGLDRGDRESAYTAGSGIVDDLPNARVAIYGIAELLPDQVEARRRVGTTGLDRSTHRTIGDVMAWARQEVAMLAGVNIEAVKLDMKLEY